MSLLPTFARLISGALLFGMAAHAAEAKQPEKDTDILGTWTLTKVLDSADVASLSDKEAAALVGKVMVVRRDSVMFNGELCRAPEMTRHREDAAKYMREGYHARAGYLGLPDTITVIDLDCTEAFPTGKDAIVVFWKGYFFSAKRQSVRAHQR